MIAAGQAGFQIAPVREPAAVVGEINFKRQADLFQIRQADRLLAFLLGAGQRRQQQRRQNGDDRDHDQQLNQGEAGPVLARNNSRAHCRRTR
jgi:hypothetical protein